MTELFSLALEIQDACQKNGWPFCVIGGLAVQHWGEPRFTRDVDLTILTGFGDEEPVIAGCLALYTPRIENARAFALQNRVLLLKSADGLGIDIALGALDFERSAVERASDIIVLEGKCLRLCSAEDLIVMTVPVPPIDLPEEVEPKHKSRATDYWRKTKNRKVGCEIRDAVKSTMRQMLEAEPDLFDSTLARKLTERAKVAISCRTVAKYRMALDIRRQGTLKEAIAEAMSQNPKVTDGEIAAMLTASTGKPVSFKTVAWNRLRLGLRKNREPLQPGQKRRTPLSVTCRKISGAMKERHAPGCRLPDQRAGHP